MKIEFVEKNYDIGQSLKNIIEKKINKLDRYFEDDAKARVVCSLQNKTFKMEVNISSKSKLFRAEVVGENMYENIDFALPKIEKQIIKYSRKSKEMFKRNAFELANLEFLQETPQEQDKQIYKTKQFDLIPMTIEDAIVNMELVSHDFYVFLNEKTNKVNILYNRHDGDLGVIETNY